MYAKAFFENLNFDSVTVAPYMGSDSVEPFLAFENKFTIMLALTSNQGGLDFQAQSLVSEEQLYQNVLKQSLTWKNNEQLMYVVGATKASYFKDIRKIIPHHFLLVPGVGAQGGNLEDVCKFGLNKDIGLLINSSRGIIYASQKEDFAQMATQKAQELQTEMAAIISEHAQ
jgi:orotidine-5'-phosphate decarboxylase